MTYEFLPFSQVMRRGVPIPNSRYSLGGVLVEEKRIQPKPEKNTPCTTRIRTMKITPRTVGLRFRTQAFITDAFSIPSLQQVICEAAKVGSVGAEDLEGGVGFVGEAVGFVAGGGQAEDAGVSRFLGSEIFAGGFAQLFRSLGDVKDVVDDLKGEAGGLSECGEGGELGVGGAGAHATESEADGEHGHGLAAMDVAEMIVTDADAFGFEIHDLATDEPAAAGGLGEFPHEIGGGVALAGSGF